MAEFSKLNYINVGPHGTFKPSGDLHTTAADIDAIFDHLSQSGAQKLAVHFHGGLVNETRGENTARKMQPVYEAGGAHALSFIWETGLIETLVRNITRINETKLFQKLLRYVFRQLTKRLGVDISGRGVGEPMTMEEIEAEFGKVEKFERLDARARGGAAHLDEASLEFARQDMEVEFLLELQSDEDFQLSGERLLHEETHLDEEIRSDMAPGGRGLELISVATHLAKVTYRVLRRYWKGRDHGLYPTTIEEVFREFYLADFGAWVWGRMKDVAKQMWMPNDGTLDETSHPGTYFLEKLKAHQSANPSFRADFIGHSAGSIAICHMLRSSDAAGTLPKIRTIVFLAPACLAGMMHQEIVSRPDRFENFRLFTMDDSFEQKDRLVPLIYPRSLLYLISGVLEAEADIPIAGMTRFWTGQTPFDDAYLTELAAWLKEAGKARHVLSVTDGGPDGMRSRSDKHGEFDDDAETLASLTHLVSQT